jgi:hypothetical protein
MNEQIKLDHPANNLSAITADAKRGMTLEILPDFRGRLGLSALDDETVFAVKVRMRAGMGQCPVRAFTPCRSEDSTDADLQGLVPGDDLFEIEFNRKIQCPRVEVNGKGQRGKSLLLTHTLPIAFKTKYIPVARRREVAFPVSIRSLRAKKQLETGRCPKTAPADRHDRGSRDRNSLGKAKKFVPYAKNITPAVHRARDLHGRQGECRRKGYEGKAVALHLMSRMIVRMAVSCSSMLLVSLNCTSALARLCPGPLTLK